MELEAPEEHDGGVLVPRDAAHVVDRQRDEPAPHRDAPVDRPSDADADSPDQTIPSRDAARDVGVDAARDAPADTRVDGAIDAGRDAPADARFDAAVDATVDATRDAPADAREAGTDATTDGPMFDVAVDDAADGLTCAVVEPPGKRFEIGVVESPAGVTFMLPGGRMIEAIQDCVDRMTAVFGAYSTVERVALTSLDDRLPRYDMIVLCSDWAEYDWDTITPHAAAFTRYVTGGGGFLMFQPNKTTRVDLLPAWYTVEYLYNDSSMSIVADHPVVCGMDRSEVPYPTDRITDFPPDWIALVRGEPSGAASLLVAELGTGRAAVDASHNSKYSIRPESDRFLERLGRWLMKSLP